MGNVHARTLLPAMCQYQKGTVLASPTVRRDLQPGQPFGYVDHSGASLLCPPVLRLRTPPLPPRVRTEPNLALYGHVRVLGSGRQPR
jgi:hypothetical protein